MNSDGSLCPDYHIYSLSSERSGIVVLVKGISNEWLDSKVFIFSLRTSFVYIQIVADFVTKKTPELIYKLNNEIMVNYKSYFL